MQHNTAYARSLRQCGLKNTKQRTAILDILDCGTQPVAAEQVYLKLKEKNIPANLSTVYRTLDILAEKKLATKLSIVGDSRALFEFNRMTHRHYLVCLACKKILAIEHCPLEEYEKALEKETRYAISGHRLDIYGYCPECRLNNRMEQ